MSTLDEITAIISADPSGFTAAMKLIHESTKETTEKVKTEFSELGELLNLYVVDKLKDMGKEAVAEFNQAEKASVLLGVAIKATGDNVGYTAEQLQTMAENLAQVSTFNGSDILQNVTEALLKFQDVHGQVFERAQKDILDYAVYTDRSLASASQIVGRALDNPLQSLTLLKRAGVAFNDTQQQMIKGFVEAGEKGKAQAIILDQMEKSFSGAAQAMKNTPWGKIQTDINAIKDALVPVGKIIETALVPVFNFIGRLAVAFTNLSPTTQKIITLMGILVVAIGPVVAAIGFLSTSLIPTMATGFTVMTGIVGTLSGAFLTLLETVGPWLALIAAIIVVTKYLSDNWNVFKDTAEAVWSFVEGVVFKYVQGILYALSKIPGAGEKFKGAMEYMRTSADEAFSNAQKHFNSTITDSVSFGDSMTDMGTKIAKGFNKVKEMVGSLFGDLKKHMKDAGKSSNDAATVVLPPWIAAFNQIALLAEIATKEVEKSFSNVATGITDTLTKGAQDWKAIIGNALQSMLKAFVDWGVHALMVALNVADAMNALFANPFAAVVVIGGLIALTAALNTPPKMAKGGMFDRATNVIVGEAGPEVILPVTRLSNGNMGVQMQGGGSQAPTASTAVVPSGMGKGGDGKDVHVTVLLDGKPILDTVAKASRTGQITIHPNAVRVSAVN